MSRAQVLLLILFAAFSAPAGALIEYGHLLEQRQVDLLPLLVIPASCAEFLENDGAFLANHLPLQGEASSAYRLSLESQQLLSRAKRTALVQQIQLLALPNSYPAYLALSYACHKQATASLEKAVQASALALKEADEETAGLEFEAGNQSSLQGLQAQTALLRSREEQEAIMQARGATPLAKLFLSASSKTTSSWDNALTSHTGIVEAVAENFKLTTELILFTQDLKQARQQLRARLLEEQTAFEVEGAVAKNRIQFIAEEELDQVADEWFAFLPSGRIAVSGSQTSFRETVRSARLDFEQAQALAGQGSKALREVKQGWAGNSFYLFASAAEWMGASLAHAKIAEERSYALEQSISQSVLAETGLLAQKAQNASLSNPLGSAYAYSVARRAWLSYEELAGAPRGRKIKEFVALLKQLRQAGEVAQQNPSFKWSVEFLQEQVAAAKRMQQAAAKDGLETSFYQRQIEQSEAAINQLKESANEDFELSTSLSQSVFDLSSSLQKEIEAKFSPLQGKLLLLGELGQFLSQAEREKLELYTSLFNGIDFYSYGSGETLGEAGQWADAKLAELSAKSPEIVTKHLVENSRTTQSVAAARLDEPAEIELFWSAGHKLPLDAKQKLTVALPELEGATDARLVSASSKVTGLAGNSLELSGSAQGDAHFASIALQKIIARETSEKTASSATGEMFEKRTTVQFIAKQAASALFEKKVSPKTSIRAETSDNFEAFENDTQGNKTVLFSVDAHTGENTITFVELTPQPVSVYKSVSYDNATGRLSVLYEISSKLDEKIAGLDLDLQEGIACLQGKTSVSSDAAQSVEQKRNGTLLAMRLKGMNFAPRQKQLALLKVECGSLSTYANAKLAELSANPQVLTGSSRELSQAQAALASGDFAAAAEIAAKIENRLGQTKRTDLEFQQEAQAFSSRAAGLEARGKELLNSSLENSRNEFSQSAKQAISSAAKASASIELAEGISANESGTLSAEEQKRQLTLLQQASDELEIGEQALSASTRLIEQEVDALLRECPANVAISPSKASACASSRQLAWQAKEKLLLQKPGGALALLEKGKSILQEWGNDRQKRRAANKLQGEGIAASLLDASALLDKSAKALADDGSQGSARRKPEFSLAIAAGKSLETEVSKAQKFSAVFATGDEEKIASLDLQALEERNGRLQNATAKLQNALDDVEALASREVDSATARSNEFGDAGTAQKVSKAKEILRAGSAITAFAIANGVNQELAKATLAKQGGFGEREAVLAGSGIAILILLAFVFTRKGAQEEGIGGHEIDAEIGKAIALSAQTASRAAENGSDEKQGEKRKPTYF